MKSSHFTQWRGSVPRDMGSSPVVDPDFWCFRDGQRCGAPSHRRGWGQGWGWRSALPQGLSVSGDGRRSSPCVLKRRRLHCPIRVNAHWVFSLLDLNKVFTKGLKEFMSHLSVYQSYGPVTQKILGHFTGRIIWQHSKIINSGIWPKVDQTQRAGDCWGRENASDNQLERTQLGPQINLFPF